MSILILFAKALAIAAGVAGGLALAPVIAFIVLICFLVALYFLAWVVETYGSGFRSRR